MHVLSPFFFINNYLYFSLNIWNRKRRTLWISTGQTFGVLFTISLRGLLFLCEVSSNCFEIANMLPIVIKKKPSPFWRWEALQSPYYFNCCELLKFIILVGISFFIILKSCSSKIIRISLGNEAHVALLHLTKKQLISFLKLTWMWNLMRHHICNLHVLTGNSSALLKYFFLICYGSHGWLLLILYTAPVAAFWPNW